MGFESRAVVEKNSAHPSIGLDDLIDAAQKKPGAFRSTDCHAKRHPGGVIEKKKCNTADSLNSSPEMFAVTKDHVHSMRIGKPSFIPVFCLLLSSGGNSHALEISPNSNPVDGRIIIYKTLCFCTPD